MSLYSIENIQVTSFFPVNLYPVPHGVLFRLLSIRQAYCCDNIKDYPRHQEFGVWSGFNLKVLSHI
jgi:hypothetical protein